jgi:hypothetical protein
MDLKHEGRQLALALVNIDDVVLVRELSGSGTNLLSLAGRSVVGTAVIGAGLATRVALLGAQVATKSALAVAGAAKGRIPGADVAEQVVYELDQSLGRGGETASALASQGVALGKADGRPPAEPIFGEAWLGKRLRPGATAGTVLVDSALDLTRLAALPLTMGTTTLTGALASPAGQQVTKSFWDAVSSILDTVSTGGGTKADRAERRATLLMLGVTPLMTAAQDVVDFGEALTLASAGDSDKLKSVLATAIERVDRSSSADRSQHTPARLFSALESGGDASSRAAAIGKALVEDRGTLSRLAVAYTTMVAGLVGTSLQSAVSAARDVGAIEVWVRADEASRAKGGNGAPGSCPASVKQLETLVAAFYATDTDGRRRGFFVPSTIELALDTIYSYSALALGREGALVRMERLFGTDVRDRLRDDCSLWGEILDAKGNRDVRLAALVSELQTEGQERLREARDHAADRLASLTSSSADRMLERVGPQRLCDRIAILQRFVALADTANALDPHRLEEAHRQRVVGRFTDWITAPPVPSDLQLA